MIAKKNGVNLKKTYKAIEISSGNSFVHTTEGKLILSGSMNAQFTMDLVCKDLRLVKKLQNKYNIPSEIIPLVLKIFNEGKRKIGTKSYSTEIIKILEEKCNVKLRSEGFPKILIDKEIRKEGIEVK